MARDTAPRARQDCGACDWSVGGLRDVPGVRGALTRGSAADIVAPRPLGRARSTLRATLPVAPTAPSSGSACGGLSLLVPDPSGSSDIPWFGASSGFRGEVGPGGVLVV